MRRRSCRKAGESDGGAIMQSRNALRGLALAVLVFVHSAAGCSRKLAPTEVADTIFINGGIYTVDAERSWAQAAAARDSASLRSAATRKCSRSRARTPRWPT